MCRALERTAYTVVQAAAHVRTLRSVVSPAFSINPGVGISVIPGGNLVTCHNNNNGKYLEYHTEIATLPPIHPQVPSPVS